MNCLGLLSRAKAKKLATSAMEMSKSGSATTMGEAALALPPLPQEQVLSSRVSHKVGEIAAKTKELILARGTVISTEALWVEGNIIVKINKSG